MRKLAEVGPSQLDRPSLVGLFRQDGAVVIRELLGRSELADLMAIAGRRLRAPGKLSSRWVVESGAPMTVDRGLFLDEPEYTELLRRTSIGAAAAQLMGSSLATLYCDHLIRKDPGFCKSTPWHRDRDAFPLSGGAMCSVWMPFQPAPSRNGAIRFVTGSHLTDAPGRAVGFADDDPLEGLIDDYSVAELQPGDAVVFDSGVLHGAFGSEFDQPGRTALSLRICGDGVTFRGYSQTPFGISTGSAEGQRLQDNAAFPLLWKAKAPIEERGL